MEKSIEIRVRGIVQGVGFRPFIYKLAKKHSLKGFVLNDSEGVKIEVSGLIGNVDKFIKDIQKSPPVLSEITSFETKVVEPTNRSDFSIIESTINKEVDTLISPDISTCKDCLNDVSNPQDRRYLYPFTNCTNCGPRFTIIEKIPYDRPNTTMKSFEMCADCLKEYEDPLDRRFHAQPNACPKCGPKLKLLDKNLKPVKAKNILEHSIKQLKAGKILAIKGLGGFHLACDAENNKAVAKLRAEKGREEKPLAIMTASLKQTERIAKITPADKKLLESPERPIVIVDKKQRHGIAQEVAPFNNQFGIMLPYTPLHHLLFNYDISKKAFRKTGSNFKALVMTSANISEEPIAITEAQAKETLMNVYDLVLTNDRKINTRADDSVVRPGKDKTIVIRRSRGFAPAPIFTKTKFREILAAGSELKNTFCLTKGNNIFLSQHIGDLKNLENYDFFKETIEYHKNILNIHPRIVAFDMHPNYLSSKYAASESFDMRIAIQHHHAHMASCMFENELTSPVIGIIADGTGYGIDGTVWGGEILVGDMGNFKRAAHLRRVAMPGADAAAQEPHRMAFSYLYAIYGKYWEDSEIDFLNRAGRDRLRFYQKMIETNTNSPLTSSLGRLFDAIASLVGIRDFNTYEGQAAFELEMSMKKETKECYPYTRYKENNSYVINTFPIVEGVIKDIQNNKKKTISAKFHNTMIKALVGAAHRVSKDTGIKEVVLSGGCFQNLYLLKGMMTRLRRKGLIPYCHKNIPTNDGGISVGQAAIANTVSNMR